MNSMKGQAHYEAVHPEMYVPDSNIDRHKCKRVVPMEVLSLGMSRTGTACKVSLPHPLPKDRVRLIAKLTTIKAIKAALKILGYNDCYHFFNIYTNVADCDMWLEAFKAKYKNPSGKLKFERKEWDALLGHCMAVTDCPANAFAPELINAYPDAKVILIDRKIEAWYSSFQIVMSAPYRPDFKIAAFLDPSWMGRLSKLMTLYIECSFGAKNQGEFEAKARQAYREHYAEVRHITPKDRLLEYELGSGWEPLCAFLGKQVPIGVAFPWINEKKVLEEKMEVLGKKSMGRAVRNVGFVVGGMVLVGAMGWRYLYM